MNMNLLNVKQISDTQVPYMNRGSRRNINHKNILKRRYNKKGQRCTGKTIENNVTAVKPLISDKVINGQEDILLGDNESILNERQHVSNVYNVSFNDTAADIGDDTGFDNVRSIEDVDFKECLSKILSE